ncbi:MAG: orotate phosphoribosyltransferase [Candidatus Omnitrophica bacterium]|nr:orotate phosphoribosyltransferase [Candidatus Omnitrophota bacterium]
MIELRKERQELLELLAKDAYVRGKVVLSSGKESDYYIDARRVTLTAKGAYLCARLVLDAVRGESYDAIGGPTLGADPMLGAIGVVSLQAGKPVNTFIIRKAPKAHGKQQQVEGPPLKQGSRVVLVDDVATTGKAFLESLDVLTPMGVKVVKAVCVLDRNEGARQALAAKGCELLSIFDISEIHK